MPLSPFFTSIFNLQSLLKQFHYSILIQFYQDMQPEVVLIDEDKLKLVERFPASIQAAHWHRQANKFGLASNQDIRVCPCCEQRVNNSQFPYWVVGTHEILPASTSLFFHLIKMAIVYLILRFLIADGINLLTNWEGADCGSTKSTSLYSCQPTLTMVSSIANKSTNHNLILLTDKFNMAAIIISCIFFLIYRFIQFKQYVKHDLSDQTQDDYSIFIRNIPIALRQPSVTNYQEKLSHVFTQIIMEFIQKGRAGQLNNKLWRSYVDAYNRPHNINAIRMVDKSQNPPFLNQFITCIDLCWDTESLENVISIRQKLKDEREQLAKKIEEAQQKEKKQQGENRQNTPAHNLLQRGKDLMDLMEKMEKPQQFFLNQDQQQENVKTPIEKMQKRKKKIEQQLDITRGVFLDMCFMMSDKKFQTPDYVMSHFVGKAFVTFQYQHYAYAIIQYAASNPIYVDGRVLEILPATNPRDVQWANMGTSQQNKSQRIANSIFLTLGVLIIAFLILCVQDYFKNSHTQQNQQSAQMLQEPQQRPTLVMILLQMAIAPILKYSISICTNLTNTIFNHSLKILTEYQKHESRTAYQLSYMTKLLISQFINTVLMIFILSLLNPIPIWSPAGLLPQITNIFIVSAFMGSGASIISGGQQKQEKPEQKYSNKVLIHQQRLNRQLELPPFNLADRYVHYILQTYTISFYAYVLPFGTLILILLFSIEYLIDKKNLFFGSTLKDDFNFDMTRVATKLFQSSVFVYALGTLIFSYQIQKHVSTFTWIGFIVATIYMVILWIIPQYIDRLFMSDLVSYEQYSYDYCKMMNKFEHTYRNQNPATKLSSQTTARKVENWLLLPQDVEALRNARR